MMKIIKYYEIEGIPLVSRLKKGGPERETSILSRRVAYNRPRATKQ